MVLDISEEKRHAQYRCCYYLHQVASASGVDIQQVSDHRY